MTDAPAVIINLPGYPFNNLTSVISIDALRALPSALLVNGQDMSVDGTSGAGGLFSWAAASLLADDGQFVVKPSDLTVLQAGRWVLGETVQIKQAIAAVAALSSPTGATNIGFIEPGTGAVARTVAAKLGELPWSIVDFGAVADSTSYTTGTNNGPAIQRAIIAAWNAGGGVVLVPGVAQPYMNQPLEKRLAYGWKGMIVLPSNVMLVGACPNSSVLRKIDTDGNAPGLTVGSFGPSNGTSLSSCTKYAINQLDASNGSINNAVTTVSAGDAANFARGDIIIIEGSQTQFGNAGQYLPNMCARVLSANASTGVITLDHAVDNGDGFGYITTGGVQPGIRKLRNDSIVALTDCSGHQWPLFVAVKAGLDNLGIDMPNTTGWGTPNLSVYDCTFQNLEMNCYYIAGNPVAYSRFDNLLVNYYSTIYEGAYGAHDTYFSRLTCARHPSGVSNVANVPLIWINQGEGGKRTHFDKISLTDRADLTGANANLAQALGLREQSSFTDSRIIMPRGTLGYAQGNSVVERNTLLSDYSAIGTTLVAFNVNNSTLRDNSIRAKGVSYPALADGTCIITGNTVGDFSNAPTTLLPSDVIFLRNAAANSRVSGNRTALGTGRPQIAQVVFQQTVTATVTPSPIADLMVASNLPIRLATDWKARVDAFIGWMLGSTANTFTLALSAIVGATRVPLASLTTTTNTLGLNSTGHLTVTYQHHEPSANNASYAIALEVGSTIYRSVANFGAGVDPTTITGFALTVSGMTSGDAVSIQSGEMFYEPMGSFI